MKRLSPAFEVERSDHRLAIQPFEGNCIPIPWVGAIQG